MITLSTLLIILVVVYTAINLVMFGMALCFMSAKEALIYLFFGSIVLTKVYIIDPWIQ